MTDDRDREAAKQESLEDEIERTRRLILERRNRFMAAALAGLGMATSGCTRASVCLEPPIEVSGHGGSGHGGGGGGGTGGARPNVCLSGRNAPPPVGGSGSGGSGTGGTGGIRPNVCLSGAMAPAPCTPSAEECDDGGTEDAGE